MLSSLSSVLFGLPDALLGPSSKNKKKTLPRKCPHILREMELPSANIKKNLIFSYI